MNLYQFTLDIQDGVNSYVQKELVIAEDDRAAAHFAREFADHWRPNALHDHEHDIYSAPEGWPQWILTGCSVITHLTVPVAGERRQVRVALVPEFKATT
jgi:hypothetical protein